MKIYKKPNIKVVSLQQKNMLLTGSNEVKSLDKSSYFNYGGSDEGYDGEER